MGGLKHTLNIGAESLYANRQGVDTAGHNIANANTEGYSRQRVNLESRVPSETRNVLIGNGVYVKNIDRAHDKFLEKQLNQSHQDLGQSDARLEAMKPLEEIYSPQLNASTSEEMTSFFQSLQELASFPEEVIVRTNVMKKADSLISTFRRIDHTLKKHRIDINEKIKGEALEIDRMIADIAKLNTAIVTLEAGDHREASDLLDKQDLLLRKLNKKIDINYYRGERGMVVVRGPQETLLVERGHSAKVAVTKDPMSDIGMYDVIIDRGSAYKPITINKINKKGILSGYLEVRDTVIPDLASKNNELAFVLGHSINAVHRQGYGVGGFKNSTNRDFFVVSDDMDRAAESIDLDSLIREDQSSIAAAFTANAPGDNIIANEMLRIRERKIMSNGDATLDEYYANTVGVFGLDLVRAEHTKQADDTLNADLVNRHDALKGVSMDEEAINLMKWQANFTASSRVITTIDEMFETVLSLKR